jgi:mRNA-degrading endonuclease RelE of RelBE toxin-antitoxin system
LRVGDYRVVFIIKGDVVTTVKIGDRQEIYK